MSKRSSLRVFFIFSQYISKLSGSLLKELTGASTQQLVQEKLIGKAKGKLSTTNLSVSEITIQLSFENLQSFGKLFSSKTTL